MNYVRQKQGDIAIILIITLVAVGAFGLGRLSVQKSEGTSLEIKGGEVKDTGTTTRIQLQ